MITSPTSNGMSRPSFGSAEALFLNQFRDALNPEIDGDISEISTSDQLDRLLSSEDSLNQRHATHSQTDGIFEDQKSFDDACHYIGLI